ncbi:uncharacterized protein LOC106639592 [Copidosoma floridanum]|uniref:uncharacterized protein LOC106639592 n=1 Tax=Copidosoma floridanum TaxID=29053 RepID=UPI000C6F7DC0|nr:uncharacterized protein LOC106639592 [Copidosoma floridanum]
MGLVERGKEMQDFDSPRPAKTRDLFGVQLEVTSLLLEAERRKLAVLQRELQAALAEGGSVKVKEKQRQELLHAISKIQAQHQQLDKEYRIHAAGVLLCNSRASGKRKKKKKKKETVSLLLLYIMELSSSSECSEYGGTGSASGGSPGEKE